MSTNTKKREYALDWLRNSVVIILIPFHAAVSFSHIGKGYIYTAQADSSFLFIFISDFFNLWIMRLLFFISGFAAFVSLRKRGAKHFIKERIHRLFLPVLFHLLLTGPLSGYILASSRYNFHGSFLSFYPQFFIHTKKYLFWGHMWYCIYLLFFSLVLLPFLLFMMGHSSFTEKINSFLIKGNRIFIPMLIVVIFEAWLRPFYPGYQSLLGDWANVAVYGSFFLTGFIMGQSSEVFELMSRKRMISLSIAVSASILFLLFKRELFINPTHRQSIMISIIWGMAAYSWVFALIGISRVYLNQNSALLKYLSRTSFTLYLFHYLIVSALLFILLKTDLSHYSSWILATAGTYLIFLILFETVLKNSRLMGYICGYQPGRQL